jgi:hypothetical protein
MLKPEPRIGAQVSDRCHLGGAGGSSARAGSSGVRPIFDLTNASAQTNFDGWKRQ